MVGPRALGIPLALASTTFLSMGAIFWTPPPVASAGLASIVTIEDGNLVVTSASGLSSSFEVSDGADIPGSYTVVDQRGESVRAETDRCTQISVDRVACDKSGISGLTLDLGDLFDFATVSANIPTLFDLGPGDDVARESPADDILLGGAGNDYFQMWTFANDADWVDGDDGRDSADYSAANSAVTITLDGHANDGPVGYKDMIDRQIERVVGSVHNDVLFGNSLANGFVGLAGDDLILGRGGEDVLEGYAGDDTLIGGPGGDRLLGDFGNDVLDGGGEGDILEGADGIDRAEYSYRSTNLTVSLDNAANDGDVGEHDNVSTDVEVVQSGQGADTLTGSSQDNTLIGGLGADTLKGMGGNDRLIDQSGGAQSDVLVGGTGIDLADFSSYSQNLVVSIDGLANDGVGASRAGNVYLDVENVTTGAGNDSVTGSALDNNLDGGGGSDKINGAEGADRLRDGGGDGDVMLGGTGVDVVDYSGRNAGLTITPNGVADDGTTGGGENDNVGADVERLVGGFGNDVISGNALDNTIYGGNGNDSINAGDGNDVVLGENGNDQLNGGAGTDTVNGGLHDDRVVDGRGTGDVLIGGAGVDFADYIYQPLGVSITLDDVANDGYSGEGDNVRSDVEKVTTGSGSDTVTGSALANTLIGGGGNDTLHGLAGNDILDGGTGTDTVNGGGGTDTCTAEATTGCP